MTEDLPEITVDEESEIITHLKGEIQFLRELVTELMKKQVPTVVKPFKTLKDFEPKGPDIIEDFDQARLTLEEHFQKEEEKRKNEKPTS